MKVVILYKCVLHHSHFRVLHVHKILSLHTNTSKPQNYEHYCKRFITFGIIRNKNSLYMRWYYKGKNMSKRFYHTSSNLFLMNLSMFVLHQKGPNYTNTLWYIYIYIYIYMPTTGLYYDAVMLGVYFYGNCK